MSLFNPNFLLYFLILISINYLFFITGGVISTFTYLKNSTNLRIFLNLLIGYVFWITVTAVYFTKWNTLFILIPISIIVWSIIFNKKLSIDKNFIDHFIIDSKGLIKQSWLLFLISILFSIKHILANGYIESDYLSYSNVSYTIKQSGLEGTNIGMFAKYIVNPYHYSDIWLTSFITEIFSTNYYLTTIFISIPILLFILYSGTIALIKEIGIYFFKKENLKYTYLYALIIFIVGGVDFPILREYMAGTIALIQIPKTSIIYIIYTLAFILVFRKQYKKVFFVTLTLTVLYTQTVFFVLPATGILILILLLRNYEEGIKYLLYYLFLVGFTGLFYYINSKFNNEITPNSYYVSKMLTGLKTFPIQLMKKTIRLLVIYFPFFFLIIFTIKKRSFKSVIIKLEKSNRFLIIIVFLVSGYFFALLFSRILSVIVSDYVQILYNGLLPLLAVLSLVAVIFSIYKFSTVKNFKYSIVTVLLYLSITMGTVLQHHRDPRYWGHLKKIDIDEEFYSKLAGTMDDDDKIATFQNFEPPDGLDWFQYNYQLYPNLSRIANFNNNGVYFPECINVHEMDTTKSEHRKYFYEKSPFIHFMDSIKRVENEINQGDAQYLFLKKYDFDYVILPDNHKTPVEVKTLIVDSIIRNDGLRIYKLNTDKLKRKYQIEIVSSINKDNDRINF